MKVLATGGMGYIGSHVVVELLERGDDVVIVDNLVNSSVEVLDKIEEITGKRPKFYEVDLRDYDELRKVFHEEKNLDLVIHFAGLKSVGESVEKPLLYYDNNLVGTINLLELMREFEVAKMIFSSSATVYGQQDSPECFESMETGRGITNPYGQTKFMIEQILKDTAAAWPEFEVICLRYFNPIGNHASGLIGEKPNGIPNNLLPYIMKVYTGELDELAVFGDDYDTPDGTCRRDYIHVVDLARGHTAATQALKPGFAVYNLGTGRPTSVKEMIETFEKVTGKPLKHRMAARRAGDLAETWANADLAKKELGWTAELTVEEAMQDSLKFAEK